MPDPIPAPKAADLVALFNFTDAIQPVLLDASREMGVFQPAAERGQSEVKTPRVEWQLHLGACISKTKLPAGSTNIRDRMPTAYACALIATVITDRVNNGEVHGQYEGLVRVMAGEFFHGINTRLPYHVFEELEEAGTTPNLFSQDAKNEDVSQIRFNGKLRIRDTAWPEGF